MKETYARGSFNSSFHRNVTRSPITTQKKGKSLTPRIIGAHTPATKTNDEDLLGLTPHIIGTKDFDEGLASDGYILHLTPHIIGTDTVVWFVFVGRYASLTPHIIGTPIIEQGLGT